MIKKSYIQFLGTLANKKRIEILLLLEKKSMNVSEIQKELNFNQTTISHNLKRLMICGFIEVKQKGKFRYYFLNKNTIKPLLKLIQEHTSKYCCHIIENKDISNRYKSKTIK